MKRGLFSRALIVLTATAFLVSGCGKSDKEVKVSDKQNAGNKSGKPLTVSVADSKLNWLGKKVTGQHNGSIKVSNGEILVDNGKVTGGKVEIDMKTIVNEDQKDEESKKKLEGHLYSPDFFDVAKFPTAKIEITKVESLNDATKPNVNSTVTGNLTMKDVTKSVTFPAEIKIENGVLTVKADFDIDRTDWNIKYGSGKFFDNLGDKVINDKFNLNLTIVAK
ncbi:MAG: YceI family protein [Ignavibacteriota bacterium]|nr:YceI family protein [Ignavibacteriota bacterium]